MISLPTSSVSGQPDSAEITAALAGESHRLATPEPITLPIGVEAFPSWLPCPAGAQRRWEPAPATGWLAAPACEADLRVLARIFSDHRTDLPAAGLPPSLLSDLMDQVRCDALPFAGYDSDQRTAWFGQGFPVDAGWDDDDLDLAHWSISGTAPSAVTPTAAVTCAASRKSRTSTQPGNGTAPACTPTITGRWASSTTCPSRCPRRDARPVPAGPGRTVRLFLLRGPGSDFSERDRAHASDHATPERPDPHV
jgi:hypothetical protein